MNRRLLLGVGVGAAAAGAGAGWAWWRQQLLAADAGAADAMWAQRFDQPGGGELRMSALRGKSLLLNFWATWCPPCVKEMPLLDRFAQAQVAKGWQVVGLAIDGPTPVRQFLARQPISFPIGLAGMEGLELTKALGNGGGQLPFTVVLDQTGRLRHRKLGAVDDALLASWVHDLA